MVFGLIVGIGYAGAVSSINAVIPQPLVQGAINGAYHIVGIVIVSSILVSLR